MSGVFAAFPYAVGLDGLTARAASAAHVQQMIEQVLFVDPGERVNRPQFGCGLRSLKFSDRNTELTTVIEAQVQGALRQWLGDLIQVQDVDVSVADAMVTVTVRYVDSRTKDVRLVRLTS